MKQIRLYESLESQGTEAVEKRGTWFAKSGMFGITAPEQGAAIAATGWLTDWDRKEAEGWKPIDAQPERTADDDVPF